MIEPAFLAVVCQSWSHNRAYNKLFRRNFCEQAAIGEETVGGLDGSFELAGIEVEIEEAVVGFLEIDEIAAVAPEAGFAAEFIDFGERGDAVGLAVEEDHGR